MRTRGLFTIVVWLGVIGCCGIGGFFFLLALRAEGAPGQAAGAALACACAVIPYVIARSIDEIGRRFPE